MSIETYFVYFLKDNSDSPKVEKEFRKVGTSITWHRGEGSFSLLHGETFDGLEGSDPLRQIRLCLEGIPEKVFAYLRSPAYAYPEVGQSVSHLSGEEISTQEGSIFIDFEGFTPSDPRLLEQDEFEFDSVMGEVNAMLAVDAWLKANPSQRVEIDSIGDPHELEMRFRSVPALTSIVDTLKAADYFRRRIEGTLFAKAPIKLG